MTPNAHAPPQPEPPDGNATAPSNTTARPAARRAHDDVKLRAFRRPREVTRYTRPHSVRTSSTKPNATNPNPGAYCGKCPTITHRNRVTDTPHARANCPGYASDNELNITNTRNRKRLRRTERSTEGGMGSMTRPRMSVGIGVVRTSRDAGVQVTLHLTWSREVRCRVT